jgi:uncharacterized SAM-binding protein YcdF (DUF218 family)
VLARALAALLCFVAAGYVECALRVSAFREENPSAVRGDVAVVLGAAVWGHARPSPVFERRLRAALSLYEQGQVRWIATTGGVGRGTHEVPLAEGVAGARWLERHGVPRARIVVEARSRNTVENLRYLAPSLRSLGLSRAVIVSDGYHLGRSVLLARDAGLRAQGVASDGGVERSLAREPRRRWSEAQWLFLYAIVRPTARW